MDLSKQREDGNINVPDIDDSNCDIENSRTSELLLSTSKDYKINELKLIEFIAKKIKNKFHRLKQAPNTLSLIQSWGMDESQADEDVEESKLDKIVESNLDGDDESSDNEGNY